MRITKKNIANARLVYWWLLCAPLLAMPCWLSLQLSLSYRHRDFLESVVAAGIPLIFYFPVFIWALSPHPFLRAHARQGVVLVVLRFFFAASIGSSETWGCLIFNVFLWLAGSIVGLSQAGKGRAWIGNIQAEIVEDPATTHPAPPGPMPIAGKPHGEESVEFYLQVFRSQDSPSIRQAAARKLEELGQVETF